MTDLRAALSDAVKRASVDEMADAMAVAIQDGTFADSTEEQIRHAVYELVARAALTTTGAPEPVIDEERLRLEAALREIATGSDQEWDGWSEVSRLRDFAGSVLSQGRST